MTITQREVASEFDRRNRHAAVILGLLRVAGAAGVTNRQLVAVSHRFGGRILDLRQDGHVIEKEHLGAGLWRYWLVERVEVTPENVTQLGLFAEVA